MTRTEHEEMARGRLEAARRWFRAHHAGVSPDSGFAQRVAARLERDRAEELGHAALQFLPATVVLALALAWFAAHMVRETSSTAAVPSDADVVDWIYGETAELP